MVGYWIPARAGISDAVNEVFLALSGFHDIRQTPEPAHKYAMRSEDRDARRRHS
jgi:hypothetical protein